MARGKGDAGTQVAAVGGGEDGRLLLHQLQSRATGRQSPAQPGPGTTPGLGSPWASRAWGQLAAGLPLCAPELPTSQQALAVPAALQPLEPRDDQVQPQASTPQPAAGGSVTQQGAGKVMGPSLLRELHSKERRGRGAQPPLSALPLFLGLCQVLNNPRHSRSAAQTPLLLPSFSNGL